MKKILASVVFCALLGAGVGGCMQLSLDSTARLEAVIAENKALALKVAEIYAKIQDGSLTLGEAKSTLEQFQDSITKNVAEIVDIKAKESMTNGALLGAIGGVAGRTLLHSVIGFLPGPLGIILRLLLGGSSTAKKEEEVKV